MPRLSWAAVGERFYETGVDRGVLYVGNDPGVAWTGLISVSESPVGGEARPYYIDGVKYLNLSSAEEFSATINAFSSPPEFGPCDGSVSVQNGLFVTQQPRRPFGFSYRTRIGNAGDGPDHGYKIHLVYNALAAPSDRSNNTIGEATEPISFSWAISTLPPAMTGYRPTAHFVIDSRKTMGGLLRIIEDILYGSENGAARLLSAQELVDMFKSDGLILRRNLAIDPAATRSGTSIGKLSWSPRSFGTGATGTTTLEASTTPIGSVTTFMRKTWSSSVDATDVGFIHATDAGSYPVTPGKTFTISSYVRTNATRKQASMRPRFLNASRVRQSALDPTSVWVTLVPNKWTRISSTFTVPEGAAYMAPWTDAGNFVDVWWAPGDTLDGTALLVEESGNLDPYFDGNTTDYDNVHFNWEGMPNDSPSVVQSWDF